MSSAFPFLRYAGAFSAFRETQGQTRNGMASWCPKHFEAPGVTPAVGRMFTLDDDRVPGGEQRGS